MNTLTDAQNWVNKEAIARRYGVNPRTVTEWMRRQMIPYIKTGSEKQSRIRFNVQAVDAALSKFNRGAA